MINVTTDGIISVSGTPAEIINECASVFLSIVIKCHDDVGTPYSKAFSTAFDLFEKNLKAGISQYIKPDDLIS